MARFKFGKNKKRSDETLSFSEEALEESHNVGGLQYPPEDVHKSPESTPLPRQTGVMASQRPAQNATNASVPAPRITVNVQTPWNRVKLYNSPFPRYRHAASSMCSDKNEIFLMGGLKDGSVFGDTWKITPHQLGDGSLEYTSQLVEVVNLNNPPARVGHSGVLCGNAFIIYGGDTVDTDFNGFPDNNFYLFNVNNNKYTIPSHVLNKPNGRYGHSVGVVALNNNSSRFYLFGGQLENDVFNDVYYFELNTFKSPKARWELVEPLNNFKPPPLTNHSMSVYKNKLFVFGGVYNNEKVSNDLWSFDAVVNKWTQLPTSGSVPAPVNEHSSCIVDDKLYIYGGNDFSGVIYDTLYVLNLHTLVWSKLMDTGMLHGPGPRCGHTMTYLPRFNKLVIMGGDKNDFINNDPDNFDTYEVSDGEEVGTMVYEFDLTVCEPFFTSEEVQVRTTKKIAASALAAPAPKRTELPQVADDAAAGFLRHARSFSAGPEDFRTPTGSPDRLKRDLNSGVASSAASGYMTLENQDKFVEVDVPSASMSEKEDTIDEEITPRSGNFLHETSYTHSESPKRNFHNGHGVAVDPIDADISREENTTPVLLRDVSQSHSTRDDSKVKALVADLTNELNLLRSSTKQQMLVATDRINALERENRELKQNNGQDQIRDLQAQVQEKDEILLEMKRQMDPSAFAVDESEGSTPGPDNIGITEKNRLKLERLELNNKLLYLQQQNNLLSKKLEEFEPFMNNQIGQLSDFQKIIGAQEEKIAKLTSQLKEQEPLQKEINEWKSRYESLRLEHENYKTIHADDEISDDEGEVIAENGGDPSNRSIMSNATGRRSKKDIASHLENLVNLWSFKNATGSHSRNISVEGAGTNPESNAMVEQLQKQLDELMRISKQQEEGASLEIQELRAELGAKLQNLKTFETNYRDALQSVNNTSRALNLTQEELDKQKVLIDKLMKENSELKIYKKASSSKRLSSKSPILEEGSTPEFSSHEPEVADDEGHISSAHFNMKIKDLEADLFILKQERDQLKENVTSLQKKLYLAQSS